MLQAQLAIADQLAVAARRVVDGPRNVVPSVIDRMLIRELSGALDAYSTVRVLDKIEQAAKGEVSP
jgi:hypothetical protein